MSLAFNALPYLAPLRGTVRRILGAQTFSYPVKVLRAVGPEVPAERPRPAGFVCPADSAMLCSGYLSRLPTGRSRR